MHICISKNISPVLQIMACRLFGAKPLSEAMQAYFQLDPKEQIAVKFYLKLKKISFMEMHLKILSTK